MKLRDLTQRDMNFLNNLDKQLRSVEIIENPRAHHDFQKRFADETFSNRKLTKRDTIRILAVSRRNNAVLYPTTTQFGFATAFGLNKIEPIAIGAHPVNELLLRFREDQLPKGYDFDTLSPYFLEDLNIRTANLAGIEIHEEKVHYVY